MGWRDDYELRQQQLAGVKQTEKINKALSTIVEGVSKDTPNTLPKINVPETNTGLKTINDNKWSGIEKAMRVYSQNAYDMSNNTPKGIGPQQWNGDNSLKNITFTPDTSIADRAAKAGERATLTYQNAFLPKVEEKISTANSPAMWNGGGDYLVPYTGKNPTVFETTMQNAKNMENPATPTAVRFGTGAYDRVYNALSSIGDSRIGSDISLKETAKQSVKNEADYRKALDEYDTAIDRLIAERDKYDVASAEYRKLNNTINAIYDGIDKIRDTSADMTEANKFMQNANLLREQATKDLSGIEKDVANAAISAVDNLITMSMAGFNPVASTALMGVSAAGQNANELSNRGVSAADALGRGVVSGVIEGLTEKIGIDNLYSIIGSGNKNLLINLLKQSLSEGTEEGLSTVLNYMVDRAAGDNKPFDWEELADAVEQGFLTGSLFGAGGTVVNTVNSYLPRVNGYSDAAHLNMAKDLESRKLKGILPDARNYKYSSDVSNSSVNIMGMPAEEYFNNRMPSVYDANTQQENIMPKVGDENTSLPKVETFQEMKAKKAAKHTPLKTDKVYHGIVSAKTSLFDKGILSDFNKARTYFINYAKNNFKTSYVNKETGKIIDVGRKGLDKVLSGNIPYEKYASAFHIPELIENATYISTADNYHIENPDRQNSIKTYSYYESPINIDGVSYMAYIRVRNTLMGDKYYGHTLGEILDDIKIEPLETRTFADKSEIQPVKEVNNDSNNIISDSAQNSNNNLGIVSPDTQKLFEAVAEAKENSKSAYQSIVNGLSPFDRITKADTRSNRRSITALANKYGQKGGVVDTILTRGMYDINGNKIDNRSWVDVASQVPAELKSEFNTYLHELHNIDRQAQGKPVTTHTIEESRKIVADLEAKYPQFKQYQKDINDYVDKVMRTYLVNTGMMSEADYLAMRKMYPNYIPTFRVGDSAGGGRSVWSGKKIKNTTGVGKAKGGTAEVMSFDEAVAKKISSVVSAAIKNDISREIFSFAQTLPTDAAKNGILIDTDANALKGQLNIDDIDRNVIKKISDGNYEVTFYDNGKPQTMKISKDVYDAYAFLDDKLGAAGFKWFANLGRALTGPMKALTTQYNPLFALTNIMRDVQTYTINNTASNSAVALKNYVKAIKEIATKSELYEQYRAMGGSQNGYYGENMYLDAYNKARPGNKKITPKGVLTAVPNAIEKVGNFTEMIPRVAEYMNTIDRLGNTNEGRLQASYNAADVTVNFNRSSTLSTFANAFVPYFNAGLQGLDKTARQIKAHPGKTTARATASVFLPTLIFYLINKDNPNWEDVKDGVRDSYYLIPNYAGPVDRNGYAETFIRIPKSREFGALFSASFERFVRALNESEEDNKEIRETLPSAFDGYLQTLTNSLMPPDILGDNIFSSMIRLESNTAWHGGKIVPSNLESVSPKYQKDINTSGLAKVVANAANGLNVGPDWLRSPMKLDYVIDSYGGYAGDLLQGLTSGKNIGSTKGETATNALYNSLVQPVINRFTTDSAYSNYNLDMFYNRMDELKVAANDRDLAEKIDESYVTPEEKILSDFTKASKEISSLTKEEKKILESKLPMTEKNERIRLLKEKKNKIAKDMLLNEERNYKKYVVDFKNNKGKKKK